MTRLRHTPAQREAVLDRWSQARQSARQIGEAVGVSEAMVNSILKTARDARDKRAELRGKGSNVGVIAPYTAVQRDAVLDAWLDGDLTEREIAEAVGVKRCNVQSILGWARRNDDPRGVIRARGQRKNGVSRVIEDDPDFDRDADRDDDRVAEWCDAHLADLVREHGAPERCPSLRDVTRREARLTLPRHAAVAVSGIGSPGALCVEG